MTVTITLTTAGTDTGPFNLYSDVDGFVSAFEVGVSKAALLAGYTTSLVPNGTTIIRVMSVNELCTNFIDIVIGGECTTTTTTSSSSTTTTTTTATPECLCYHILNETAGPLDYTYIECGKIEPDTYSLGAGLNTQVCSPSVPTGFSLTIYPCTSTTNCTNSGECEGCS